METKAGNPLQSDIFKKKFVDDETPLNAKNLNPILEAILLVNGNNNSSSKNLQSQITTETTARENADSSLQTQINEEKTALQNQIGTKENAFSVMITDGGGVPQSVIDGTNTTWNGEFEEV